MIAKKELETHLHTFLDVMGNAIAGIGFHNIFCGLPGFEVLLRKGLRAVVDAYDLHIFIHEDDIQGQGRIRHPEAARLVLLENKQHALRLGQVPHIHKPLIALGILIGDGDLYGREGIAGCRYKGHCTNIF